MTLYQIYHLKTATQPTQTLVKSLGRCLLTPHRRFAGHLQGLGLFRVAKYYRSALNKTEVIPTEQSPLPKRIQRTTTQLQLIHRQGSWAGGMPEYDPPTNHDPQRAKVKRREMSKRAYGVYIMHMYEAGRLRGG